MFIALSTLWFLCELKYVLFWLYLWQLKDYHIGRFLDHFRTYKGRRVIFSYAQLSKLVLIFLFLELKSVSNYLFYLWFIVYLVDLALFFRAFYNKNLKIPVKTVKTLFLSVVSIVVVFSFVALISGLENYLQAALFLGFDILTPLIISIIVLIFQPVSVLMRIYTLNKAKKKIAGIKAKSGLKVIAITGSYGKTTTKEFLATILSRKFKVLRTKEHQNSEIGIAKCILKDLDESYKIFIAEIGAYNKGKVKEVCSVLGPKIGIVTGVNEQHLALFGSMENLLSAEGGVELAKALGKNGILFVNGDNKYCLDLSKRSPFPSTEQKKIYSLENKTIDADIWADSITVYKDKISFVSINKTREMAHFDVRVLGKQNVQNLLGAILVAKELGMKFDEISEACRNISQKQGGITLLRGRFGIEIVDSSYSANPDGVFADLNYFSVFKGKRTIIMPSLIELGSKSVEIHEKIGRKIAEVCDSAIITSKDRFKEIKKGAMACGMPESAILLCDNAKDIYMMVTLVCKIGDAVLLEGRVPAGLIEMLKK